MLQVHNSKFKIQFKKCNTRKLLLQGIVEYLLEESEDANTTALYSYCSNHLKK